MQIPYCYPDTPFPTLVLAKESAKSFAPQKKEGKKGKKSGQGKKRIKLHKAYEIINKFQENITKRSGFGAQTKRTAADNSSPTGEK